MTGEPCNSPDSSRQVFRRFQSRGISLTIKNPHLAGSRSFGDYFSIHIPWNEAIHFTWDVLHLFNKLSGVC